MVSHETSSTLPPDGNWERQRRTGRFIIEPYTREETQAWLEVAGMPPMLQDETDEQYRDRISGLRAELQSKEGQGE